MLKLILVFIGSVVLSIVAGKFIVDYLRKVHAGQHIREDGPVWHKTKEGTPTMGGLIFILPTVVLTVACSVKEMASGSWTHLIVLAFALVYGAIGFLDDYEKLKKKQNLGLTARQKFLLQLIVAVGFLLLLYFTGHINTDLFIPFFGVRWTIPPVIYFIFAAFVMVGCVNAVNITDGVDGLVGGVTLPVALCYGAMAACWLDKFAAVGIEAAALAGGLVGFLVYNFHPAKIFMGDTGSLFLGGIVCAFAFAFDMPLLLIPLGLIYIVETLSDIIQVTYFKLTHGKRIFKMAPLHHHLELCGWKETKIFTVFTAISVIMAVLSYFGAMA